MAVGVRSSSRMRSSLRSISSRRRRIEERLLSEVITHRNAREETPSHHFWLGPLRLAEVRPCGRSGGRCCLLPHMPAERSLVALTPLTGFVGSSQRFVRRSQQTASLLADQQKKHSDSDQHRNQNTKNKRNNRMPEQRRKALGRSLRPKTQPEEKFVHSGRSLSQAGGVSVFSGMVARPRRARGAK
jgi:hypothetical protein